VPFRDEAHIQVRAGKGGDGKSSFRREKYVQKGGPDGGDGGDGGDVIMIADKTISSLEWFETRRNLSAEHGRPGGGAKCSGKNGQDLVIKVPAGTLVRDEERGHVLKDLDRHLAEVVLANGGKGGRGNARFATATDRTPTKATQGTPGESRRLWLELKIIADVGLLGFPNAGKSTLLHALSGADARVGDYPFTTLTPNLGILEHEWEPYVIADVPGLIEGASEGKGLGHQFLRHVERTRVLLHLIDAADDTRDVLERYRTVRGEITAFSDELAVRREIVVVTKMDLVEDAEHVKRELAEAGVTAHYIAAADEGRAGIDGLIGALVDAVAEARGGD